MRTKSILLFLIVCASALPQLLQAQGPAPAFGGHYPAGVEGIKAGSLPPPGFYLRDYSYFYWSDKLKNGPPDFDLFAYVQAPRAIWISDYRILGANFGADVLIPFVHTDVTAGGGKDNDFGIGDIHVEPITLSWHGAGYDLAVGYAFWAPTGEFDAKRPVRPGKGFWSSMLTAGGTWYMDQEKTWSLSVLNRYEIHTENEEIPITPGHTFTLEWGVGRSLTKSLELGLVGYYQQQTTTDDGAGASDLRDHAVGIGPEVSLFCPKLGVFASVRYLQEIAVKDRPEGNTVTLTLTRRW